MSTVEPSVEPAVAPPRWRVWTARVLTVLAVLLVLAVLVAPSEYGRLTPLAFLRLPAEALLAVGLLLALPSRGRAIAATVIGVAVGLLGIGRVADLGFFAVLDRPFDPVLDWPFFSSGLVFVSNSFGRAAAFGVVAVAAALAVGTLVLTTLSARRVGRLLARHRPVATRVTAGLAVVWVACALLGVHIVRGVPIATHPYYDRAAQAVAAVKDGETFATEVASDAYRYTPGNELLTGLRGKDVVIAYIESYGRISFDDPTLAARLEPYLDAGYARLKAAGYDARTGLLTSPTAGGGSWLAESTLRSGVWIDNQQRFRDLPATGHLTLGTAFRKAGWRTVAVMPGTTADWPESVYFGFDQVYKSGDMGYSGPRFSFATMPDQYTMRAFQRLERLVFFT